MIQRDSLALALAFTLLSVCACSGQSVGNYWRRVSAQQNGTLNQELAREELDRKHSQLIAAVKQACPSDTATEQACEDAATKADPAAS